MNRWHSCMVTFLAALILHTSALAAMPLVRCIGTHGHNAIELCVGPSCHQNETVKPARNNGALGEVLIADDAHSELCVDGKPTEEQLAAPQAEPLVAMPVFVTLPAPLAIANCSMVIPGTRVLRQRPPLSHALPTSPRSTVLRI
jgi:hypothetical protein